MCGALPGARGHSGQWLREGLPAPGPTATSPRGICLPCETCLPTVRKSRGQQENVGRGVSGGGTVHAEPPPWGPQGTEGHGQEEDRAPGGAGRWPEAVAGDTSGDPVGGASAFAWAWARQAPPLLAELLFTRSLSSLPPLPAHGERCGLHSRHLGGPSSVPRGQQPHLAPPGSRAALALGPLCRERPLRTTRSLLPAPTCPRG